MRNIIILSLALALGGAGAQAHKKSGKIRGCKTAQAFVERHGASLDKLFDAEAIGDLKTLQDLGKMKLDLLRKLVSSDTPYHPACRLIGKKVSKLALVVAIKRAKLSNENAAPETVEKAE